MSDPVSPGSMDPERHHTNRASPLIALNITIVALAAVAVALRLWARITTKAKLMKDDFLIVISLILAIGVCVIAILQFQQGLGTRTFEYYSREMSKISELRYWAMMIITPCLATTRLSILAFYHRLFPTRSFRIALWVVAIIVFAQAIIFFFLLAFPCIPIRAVWSRLEDSKCMDYYTVYLAQAGFNVPIDSIILVMPMIIIWRLQMTLRRKLALTVTFVIGSGALAAAIVGLYLSRRLQNAQYSDLLAEATRIQIWVNIEPCIGILAACLPVVGPPLRKYFKQTKFWGANSRVVSNSMPTLFRTLDSSHGAGGPDSNASKDAILRIPEVAHGCNRSGKVTASRELMALDEDELWQPEGLARHSGAKPLSAHDSQL